MNYLTEGSPSRAYDVREGDNTPVETMGNPYGYARFHIRGPDGPRGGRRTLCGARPRYSGVYGGCTAQIVVNTVQRRYPNSFTPTNYWYGMYVCRNCARQWVENAIRSA